MRKSLFFLFAFLLLIPLNGTCDNPTVIVKDVRGEIFEEGAEITIESSGDFAYLDYSLQNPPQIIIDPIGKVYSDLKDTITFNDGPIKQVMVVKGKTEGGMSGNFYPLDFISIELVKPLPYTINKHNEITVEIGRVKGTEAAKLLPAAEEAIPAPEPLPEEIGPEEAVPAVPVFEEPAPAAPEPAGINQEVIPLEAREVPPPQTQEAAPAQEEQVRLIYTIGEGDTLDVSVWQHPDLDRKVVVRPDGYISFPLVGDLKAVGSKPPELASLIKENLARLIKDPQVTVIVAGFGSKNIFVLGEVDKPGAYPYKGGINVLDAISMAGGWKNSAVLNSVILVRKAFTDAPEAYRLNVYALIKKGDFSQNLELKTGDIVYVPKSFIANIGGFIENLRVTVGAYITNSTNIFD